MVAAAGLLALGLPVTAAPASALGQCADPTGTYTGAVPWGQRLVDPQRLWPLSRGEGQVVAVIGTGVDGQNAQFAPGQVLGGPGTAPSDCDGRGTIAAGIVGAQPADATTFTGVAPAAKILPLRYTESNGSSAEGGGDPGALAGAIDTALNRGAGVLLIAVPAGSDSPGLDTAVERARAAGAVVVSPAAATQQGAHSYPTTSSGVLAVGSTNQAGQPVQTETGDYLGVAAPGANLVSTSAGGGGSVAHRWPVTDPGLAAAYVAGVAALVRAAHPNLTGDQVVTRLTLTASRPPSGAHDPRRGWGVLDAYAAVSSTLPADVPGPGAPVRPVSLPAVVPAPAPTRPDTDLAAGLIALGGVVAAAVAGLVVAAVRRGKRRAWRPSRFGS
ncbi:S8 family serine peptidase [Amycolatopsis sp. PS_44_ISF1]|uniref:S8 family serine peptidase n=1 Tax=Amycolatopsis sp. PS_44_ISF1 TaxID=2974917 RepID=UPI0028DF0EC3|nr:S8 family serine peptidase [Amycolatopsis sp. PS_44_ISF1]MDT8914369.1 S8 family serine peptidase [Amycolatopsis sp. PS_44_ISF1]